MTRLAVLAAILYAPTQDNVVEVSVDGGRVRQRIDGFGVNALASHWNNGELAAAIDLLVDQMGATIFRVVFYGRPLWDGAGKQLSHASVWEEQNDNADPNSFNWTAYNRIYEGPYFQELWSTIAYLEKKGARPILDFMGLVPEWMGGTSIREDREDEFAEMIVSAVVYGRKTRRLKFTLLSPMNEHDLGALEGPKVEPAQYARLLRRIGDRLDALGLSDVRFSAPDIAGVQNARAYLAPLRADAAVRAKIDHCAFHNYGGDSGEIAALVRPDGRFWMTEWSQMSTDSNLDDGRPVKDEWAFTRVHMTHLFNHLRDGASAALAWDAYDNVPD